MRFRVCLAAALLGVVFLSGCGNSNLASVKGRVTCNGAPVKEAQITFSPAPKSEGDLVSGKAGTGFTDNEGIFELSTYKALDGALIGEHHVVVMLDDTNPAKCKREKRLVLEVKSSGNNFEIELNK